LQVVALEDSAVLIQVCVLVVVALVDINIFQVISRLQMELRIISRLVQQVLHPLVRRTQMELQVLHQKSL
jgi:hypothetical protein